VGPTDNEGTAQLLWEAGRVQPRAAAVHDALAAGAEPVTAVRHAGAHGLGPLLWRALGLAGRRDWLGPAHLDLANQAALRHHEALLLLPHAVSTAVRPLLDARLEPVVFKGPTLAGRYPEPGLRAMGDLDLLLPPQDHQRALAALQRAGWVVVRPADRRHYESALVHPAVPGLPLELHRGLDVWYERSNRLPAGELWRRRIPIDCLGTPAFGLPPEEEVVALAAHAGKPYHCFERLIWSVDIAVVVDSARASGTEVDWCRVAPLADTWRCRTVLAVALTHAGRLGQTVPSELSRLAGSRIRLAALAPLLEHRWPLIEHDDGLRNRLRYALVDDWPRRLALFGSSPGPVTPARRWPGELARVSGLAVRRTWQLWRDDRGRHHATSR
jgi:hypothetical protein